MHGRQEWPATGGFASQLSQRLPSSLNESAHREGSGPPPICSFSRVEQSRAEQFSSVQFSSVYCWWIYIDCKSRGGGLFLPEGRECTYVTLTFNTRYLYLFSNVSQHLTSPFTPERCSLCCRLKQENEKNTEEGEQKKNNNISVDRTRRCATTGL